MEEQLQLRRIISRAGFALFFMAAAVLGSQLILDQLITHFDASITKTDWYSWAVTAISIIGIGFPIFYLIIRRIPDSPKGESEKMTLLRFIVIFFICASAMYITNIFSSILTVLIALAKGQKELVNPIEEIMVNSNFIVSLIYATVVAPIMEELIFRKLLLNKLRRFGDIPAILMTGIAFGLFHMNLSQFFYAAVLGFIFAYVTIKTNTILYSILLHMSVNFIGTIVTPLATSQNPIFTFFLLQWMFVAILIGLMCFGFNFKKIRFEKSEVILTDKGVYIKNVGTLLYLLLCLVMIGIITIFS